MLGLAKKRRNRQARPTTATAHTMKSISTRTNGQNDRSKESLVTLEMGYGLLEIKVRFSTLEPMTKGATSRLGSTNDEPNKRIKQAPLANCAEKQGASAWWWCVKVQKHCANSRRASAPPPSSPLKLVRFALCLIHSENYRVTASTGARTFPFGGRLSFVTNAHTPCRRSRSTTPADTLSKTSDFTRTLPSHCTRG